MRTVITRENALKVKRPEERVCHRATPSSMATVTGHSVDINMSACSALRLHTEQRSVRLTTSTSRKSPVPPANKVSRNEVPRNVKRSVHLIHGTGETGHGMRNHRNNELSYCVCNSIKGIICKREMPLGPAIAMGFRFATGIVSGADID